MCKFYKMALQRIKNLITNPLDKLIYRVKIQRVRRSDVPSNVYVNPGCSLHEVKMGLTFSLSFKG